MPDFADVWGASKAASALLVLFIPSKDRSDKPIDQGFWVDEAMNVLEALRRSNRLSAGSRGMA